MRVFAELFRKTRELEQLNAELEHHVAERTAELASSNAKLRQSEQGRSLALAAGQMGSWEWDISADEWTWDEGQYRIFGVDPLKFSITAANVRSLIHPDDWNALEQIARSISEGALTQQAEFRVRQPDGKIRWCIGTAAASLDGLGRPARVSGVTIDITGRKQAEELQMLLSREVDHRARNMLAVIQSIVRLTRANSVDDYVRAIEGRIKALARAHTLVSDSRWNGADLGTLVAEELAPYRTGDKISFDGPDVSLEPVTAQGLALALHELATNAAKHGALSSTNGRVNVDWQLQPSAFTLQWTENGGPRTGAPSAQNFGLRVISTSIERQLGGKVTFDWEEKGLRCIMSIPRCELGATKTINNARSHRAEKIVGRRLKSTDKPRVLVVEDEALVAMMMQETFADLGFQVIGPVSSAEKAIAVAQEAHFDAAVLDINLGDGLTYAVADILEKRGVPFAFVTGYDFDSIDSRFDSIPILRKPVEPIMLQRMFVADHPDGQAGAY